MNKQNMKISIVIEKLQKLQKQYGDLPCMLVNEEHCFEMVFPTYFTDEDLQKDTGGYKEIIIF